MFATFNSGNTNPYLGANTRSYPTPGSMQKSFSNNQLDKAHLNKGLHTKGSSFYALNNVKDSLEKLAHSKSQSDVKCHHLSTTNLDKIKPQCASKTNGINKGRD